MILRLLPLFVGFLPIIGIHLSYIIAMNAGVVQECIPYIDGCVTISATGRYPPSTYLFKGVMLPQALLLAVYWLFAVAWYRAISGASAGPVRPIDRWIGGFGVAGALFLILYVTFLGAYDEFYTLMRRFGVYFYFLCSVVAQLIMTAQILRHGNDPALRKQGKIMLFLVISPFVLGIFNWTMKAILGDDAGPIESRVEWTVSLMMQLWFVVSYYSWKTTEFSGSYKVREGEWLRQ